MNPLRHLIIFFAFYLPIAFVSQMLGQMFSMHIDLYGLYFMAAVCGLERTEAVIAMLLLGFWLDALQPDMRMFGFRALPMSAFIYACHKQTWRAVFEAHPRFLGVFVQCLLQASYLLCVLVINRIPVRCLKFYFLSILLSAVLTAILAPPLLRFQRKYCRTTE